MVTKVAKLHVGNPQEVEIPPSVTATLLRVVPRLVNGRIELHWENLPEDSRITHPKPDRSKP